MDISQPNQKTIIFFDFLEPLGLPNLTLNIGLRKNLRYGKHFNIEHIFKISRILEVKREEFFR